MFIVAFLLRINTKIKVAHLMQNKALQTLFSEVFTAANLLAQPSQKFTLHRYLTKTYTKNKH